MVVGGSGNDVIKGGAGRNVLIGGGGSNQLHAGRDGDVLVAGSIQPDDDNPEEHAQALFDLLDAWNSDESFEDRAQHMEDLLDSLALKNHDDESNTLFGGAGHDLFFANQDDELRGNKKQYPVVEMQAE